MTMSFAVAGICNGFMFVRIGMGGAHAQAEREVGGVLRRPNVQTQNQAHRLESRQNFSKTPPRNPRDKACLHFAPAFVAKNKMQAAIIDVAITTATT